MYCDSKLDFSKTIKPYPPKEGTAGWALNLPDSGSRPKRGYRR
jgi:hypothetical protein